MLKKLITRPLQGSNLRGNFPVDFKSTTLTTRSNGRNIRFLCIFQTTLCVTRMSVNIKFKYTFKGTIFDRYSVHLMHNFALSTKSLRLNK